MLSMCVRSTQGVRTMHLRLVEFADAAPTLNGVAENLGAVASRACPRATSRLLHDIRDKAAERIVIDRLKCSNSGHWRWRTRTWGWFPPEPIVDQFEYTITHFGVVVRAKSFLSIVRVDDEPLHEEAMIGLDEAHHMPRVLQPKEIDGLRGRNSSPPLM